MVLFCDNCVFTLKLRVYHVLLRLIANYYKHPVPIHVSDRFIHNYILFSFQLIIKSIRLEQIIFFCSQKIKCLS